MKFDFLGLKTLTVLNRAVENVKRTTGVVIDLAAIPLDDEKTFQMLARGETVGVFQLESTGMRDTVRKMRADRFEDIIAIVALYRPGRWTIFRTTSPSSMAPKRRIICIRAWNGS